MADTTIKHSDGVSQVNVKATEVSDEEYAENVQAGGFIKTVTTQLTVSTTPAYGAGDLVGGKVTLTDAVRISGGTGRIKSVMVSDLGKQSIGLDVIFFNSNPSGTTFTDNAALDIADADITKVIAVVSVGTTSFAALSDNSVGDAGDVDRPFTADGSADIYACIVTRGAPTYPSTSDIQLRVAIQQD
jgi:hypothetical protein